MSDSARRAPERVTRVDAHGRIVGSSNKLAAILTTFIRTHPHACVGFMVLALTRAVLRALALPHYQGALVQSMTDASGAHITGSITDLLREAFDRDAHTPSAAVGRRVLQFVGVLCGTIASTIAYDYASAALLPLFVSDLRKYLIYDQLERHERDISDLDVATAITDLCTVYLQCSFRHNCPYCFQFIRF